MSDVPELIESIDVEIEQIDKINTPYSDGVAGRRENYNHVVRKTKITLPAQVVFGKTPSDEAITLFKSQLGPDEAIRGYMIMRFQDLADKGVALKRGDKIVKMGQLVVDLYVSHSTNDPAAHFSSIGGFTLLRVFFNDRNVVGGEAR
jgi:hypothetical protein